MAKPECPPEFTRELRGAVVDALLASYRTALTTYSPDEGLGDRVFGMAVFDALTWHFERVLAERFPYVRFESRGNGPELRIGDLRVRWNKVGREVTSSGIARSFPRPSRAAGLMAQENQTMPLWADDVDLGRPLNWFVCHFGNPIDGLLAVYLASPMTADGEQITGWHSTIAIWSATDPDSEFPALPPPGPPEAVALPAWNISLIDEDETEADAG